MKNGKWKTVKVKRFPAFAFEVFRSRFSSISAASFPLFSFLCLFLAACGSLEKPKPEPFYSDAAAPSPQKEFRWSNGGRLPASLDPALAVASPEIDLARAVYEGLTDTDARTLKTVPAIAVDWSTSDDNRTWTFKLRRDARWSNGERVTAADFVRSWKRLAARAAKEAHFNLLINIVGVQTAKNRIDSTEFQSGAAIDVFSPKDSSRTFPPIFKPNGADETVRQKSQSNAQSKAEREENAAGEKNQIEENADVIKPKKKSRVSTDETFGAVAVDDFTLKVSLLKPDKDFPALVAHPIFRPVFGDGKNLETTKFNADIVTNGAFRIESVNPTDGVTLRKSESFWNKAEVELERVRFVPTGNAEQALEAYRAGLIDAVTNADFEPLALKLLTPFEDFRRTPHSALNFYEFNRGRAPFDDRRVREALTIAVERERLTQDELDGASVPALHFLPFGAEKNSSLSQSIERARNLLTAAGFAGGEDFPVVRLVVNRNNVQQRIARAVARMWKQNLNIETEIVVKEQAEIEAARNIGDFDVLRRGALFPTTDEAMNMQTMFSARNQSQKSSSEAAKAASGEPAEENKNAAAANAQANSAAPVAAAAENADGAPNAADSEQNENSAQTSVDGANQIREISTETDALDEFAAIPLYFATSYSLVKPYIHGFDMNTLDAPSLKNVRIDNGWQPKAAKSES